MGKDILHYFLCFILAFIIPFVVITAVLLIAKFVFFVMPYLIEFYKFTGLINT